MDVHHLLNSEPLAPSRSDAPAESEESTSKSSQNHVSPSRSSESPTQLPRPELDDASTERPAKKKARLTKKKQERPRRMPPPIWAQSIRKVPLKSKHEIAQAREPEAGPLGLLEPSITGFVPSDEIVRMISDFLYTQLIIYQNIGFQTSSNNPGQSAVLEIEAKFGRIVDKNTNDRLQLPVLTETVLNRDHPNLRTSFESSLSQVGSLCVGLAFEVYQSCVAAELDTKSCAQRLSQPRLNGNSM